MLDTSALVKLYYPEPGSERIETWVEESSISYISRLAVIEFHSALYRKYRENELNEDDLNGIKETFKNDIDNTQYEIIEIEEQLPQQAIELIMKYGKNQGIKTLDALQVAFAEKAEDFTFVTSDKNLIKILKQLNIDIANPED
ncbi:MAG: type II toxin-antitoxin system VapC family toxin [Spirochaetota bacterium]